MERQERNLAIKTIMEVVKNKYPNYQSNDEVAKTKLISFKSIITKGEALKAFNFVDYSVSYIVRNENAITKDLLVDDILSIAVIFDKQPKNMSELSQESMDNYIRLVRNKTYDKIVRLNKLILNEEITQKLFNLSSYFTSDKDYTEYVNSILTPALLRYRMKKQSGMTEEKAISEIQSDINLTLDNALNTTPQHGHLQRRLTKQQPIKK